MNTGVSLILLGVMIVAGSIFFIVSKKNDPTSGENKTKKTSNESGKIDSNIRKEDVFKFMDFDRIQDDMIVQNKGQKFTMAIKCKGVNYDLMSDVEQMAIEEGFITFLNTLKYPIQLYVQAQNIDLKSAINTYKENVAGIKREYDEKSLEYARVTEAFESTQAEIDEASRKKEEIANVYEYANDIISYVEVMSTNKNLLQRSFYVLVSYYTSEINSAEKFSKQEIENICYSELYTRAQSIISALASCSVEGKILNSNELADLLYTAYNRDDKGIMNVKEAIESGFYRLYSTSEDAFAKKQELLKQEIENNAKIKAYEAITKTIEDGSYISPKMNELKIEEDTSRLANEIIKREDLPLEVKDAAQKKVIEEYRETKKNYGEEIKKEKEELLKEANEVLKGNGIKMNSNNTSNVNNNNSNSINRSVNNGQNEKLEKHNENDSII